MWCYVVQSSLSLAFGVCPTSSRQLAKTPRQETCQFYQPCLTDTNTHLFGRMTCVKTKAHDSTPPLRAQCFVRFHPFGFDSFYNNVIYTRLQEQVAVFFADGHTRSQHQEVELDRGLLHTRWQLRRLPWLVPLHPIAHYYMTGSTPTHINTSTVRYNACDRNAFHT